MKVCTSASQLMNKIELLLLYILNLFRVESLQQVPSISRLWFMLVSSILALLFFFSIQRGCGCLTFIHCLSRNCLLNILSFHSYPFCIELHIYIYIYIYIYIQGCQLLSSAWSENSYNLFTVCISAVLVELSLFEWQI